MKKLFFVLLCASLLLLTSCGDNVREVTPSGYILEINSLVGEQFGGIEVTETVDANTRLCQISDCVCLTLASDPVTGILNQAELCLYLTESPDTLDYSLFEHYFLILLKAHDPDISITSLNTVHDTLGIETYKAGTDAKIGYGSNTFFYTVDEEKAIFSAQFGLASETLQP